MSDSEKSNSRLFDLDQLRAIVTVADCGSFTTAAARLHSTQSTVSQKVRRLEEMAGHRLLERGNRDVLPTDAGDTLLGYARRLLALNDELAEALSGATVALTVRIGVPDDFAAGRCSSATSNTSTAGSPAFFGSTAWPALTARSGSRPMPMPSAMADCRPLRLELVKLMCQRRPTASRAAIISSR